MKFNIIKQPENVTPHLSHPGVGDHVNRDDPKLRGVGDQIDNDDPSNHQEEDLTFSDYQRGVRQPAKPRAAPRPRRRLPLKP